MRTRVLLAMMLASGVAHASQRPREIEIYVMADGDVTINKGPVLSLSKLEKQLRPLLRRKPCVPFKIIGDRGVPFEPISRVVFLLRRHHCSGKIGFITEPHPIETTTPATLN